MDFFSSMRVSASGLEAQTKRINAVSSNIANAESTQSAEDAGGPYRKRTAVLAAETDRESFGEILADEMDEQVQGVRTTEIAKDPSPPRMVYDPTHVHANADGYVAMPNVNVVHEMADMISAQRSYEANATALGAAKSMAQKALEIGR